MQFLVIAPWGREAMAAGREGRLGCSHGIHTQRAVGDNCSQAVTFTILFCLRPQPKEWCCPQKADLPFSVNLIHI